MAGLPPPFVDVRSYVDGAPPPPFDALKDVDVHDGYHSQVMARAAAQVQRNAANHVMLTSASYAACRPIPVPSARRWTKCQAKALAQLDKWLTAGGQRQIGHAARQQSLPRTSLPTWWTRASDRGRSAGRLPVEKVTDMERCKKLFPFAGDARLAAGAPASDDVDECALKPIDAADYKTPPTAEQLARLRQVFPRGRVRLHQVGIEQAHLAAPGPISRRRRIRGARIPTLSGPNRQRDERKIETRVHDAETTVSPVLRIRRRR